MRSMIGYTRQGLQTKNRISGSNESGGSRSRSRLSTWYKYNSCSQVSAYQPLNKTDLEIELENAEDVTLQNEISKFRDTYLDEEQ